MAGACAVKSPGDPYVFLAARAYTFEHYNKRQRLTMHLIIGFVLLVFAFGFFPRVAFALLGLGVAGFLTLVTLSTYHGGMLSSVM